MLRDPKRKPTGYTSTGDWNGTGDRPSSFNQKNMEDIRSCWDAALEFAKKNSLEIPDEQKDAFNEYIKRLDRDIKYGFGARDSDYKRLYNVIISVNNYLEKKTSMGGGRTKTKKVTQTKRGTRKAKQSRRK